MIACARSSDVKDNSHVLALILSISSLLSSRIISII